MTPRRFILFFSWFHLIYTILLMLLLFNYTSRNGYVWFMFLQCAFVGAVFVVHEMFPSFVKRAAHLKIIKSAWPTIIMSEILHVYLLGLVGEKYYQKDASFFAFFPVMLVMKMLIGMALGYTTPK